MDVTALASAFIGAKAAEVQMAVAAKMMKMNAAQSVVQVIEAAQQNLDCLADVAAGIGGNLDISV